MMFDIDAAEQKFFEYFYTGVEKTADFFEDLFEATRQALEELED